MQYKAKKVKGKQLYQIYNEGNGKILLHTKTKKKAMGFIRIARLAGDSALDTYLHVLQHNISIYQQLIQEAMINPRTYIAQSSDWLFNPIPLEIQITNNNEPNAVLV